jgi:arginine N-succinyltransferase
MNPESPRFVIAAGTVEHTEELLALAYHLDTVNLPNDRQAVEGVLRASEGSFSGTLAPVANRRYVFVVQDKQTGHLVGTSSIVAQLGRPDAPYVFLDVSTEEKYSRDRKLHYHHQVLRLGFSYDGPTELAGLVVDPNYRQHPARLGLSISYMRLLYIAAQRGLFQDELLAELLPPLEPDGRSHLWDALGKRFTNLTYREADRLSHENKDFIRDLFPSQSVYSCLLSEEAQRVIGEVGAQTKGVEKMLTRIGFSYNDRVDPFDGGPHFTATTDDVTPIRAYRTLPAVVDSPSDLTLVLVGRFWSHAPYALAVTTYVGLAPDYVAVSEAVLEALQSQPGDMLHIIPLR